MADAIVSVVLEQLASIFRQQIEQKVTLSKEVKRLTSNFQAIQAVLVDAEHRQVKETSVRVWLDKLKDVSFDADNLLDEWITSKLKLQMQRAENALTLKKKVCSFFLSPCFSFRKVFLHHDIALRIKELNESLDVIAVDKERYNFSTITSVEQPRGVETTSFIDEYTVWGRDKEKNTLMSRLLCESSNEHEGLHTISIVGMGGMGKTTLAQLAFNNNEVKNIFAKRIWVCVSNPFDKLRVANAIIQGLEGQCCSSSATLEFVLQSIHQSIAGKKILLVLDDVWTEDYINDWEQLYNCLKNCLNGSKIVVTTRKETVARMMNSIVIPITELSENECWSLFKHFSFMGRSDDECRELENVGKEIVSKCKGLPLAAKTMGSLLRFKRTRKEWENILNSGMWELDEFEKGIFPPLLLSYNDLPLMVKRCFSYCVIFPKDYQLHKDELIKLWMAQGYLGLEQKKEMVMIGEEYFNILSARSFFQEFIKDDIGGVVGCKMHDIVHDFGQFITKNECFAMKDNDFGDSGINFSFEKARHLILMVDENSSFPISICNIKNLRSLLIQNLSMNSFDGVLLKFLGQNTCLRALAMGGTAKFDMMTGLPYLYPIKLERIPKEIRKLIHLRYLDLSKNTALEMLPEELCELCNLQTLNVSRCYYLKELPQGMGKLINLRHLVNYYADSLKYMPKGIEKLTCLQTLSQFHVSGSDYRRKACSLDFLNQFCHLEGYLFIKGLGNVTNVSKAQRIELKNKKNIFELELGFGGSDSVNNEAIIEALQPPPNLQTLTISEYAGSTVLPNWITSLTNLRSISLVEWINCEQLPPLGKVSSLESIVIHEMKRVKRVGIEILGIALSSSSSSVFAFPKLKSLRFVKMEEWEEWDFGIEDDNITIMPSLRLLQIKNCPKLKVFPKKILQMTPLEVLSMDGCPILSERYRKGTGENWSDISHIPNIKIDDEYVQRDGR